MTKYGVWLGDEEFAIGIFNNDTEHVVQKDSQNLTFPLLVAFSNAGITFDFAAKNAISQNYQTTISHLRQFIGRSYKDKYIKGISDLVPFQIGESSLKNPYFSLKLHNNEANYSPESLMSIFFLQLKYLIKRLNDDQITDVTIAVPEYFTNRQIRALEFCAEAAKIKHVHIQYEAEMFACALYQRWKKPIEFGFLTMEFNNISYSQIKVTAEKGKVLVKTLFAQSAILTNIPEIMLRDYIIEKITAADPKVNIQEKDKIKLQIKAKELIAELSHLTKVTLDLDEYCPKYVIEFTKSNLATLFDPCFDEISEKIFDNITVNNIEYVAFMGDIANIEYLIEQINGYFADNVKPIDLPNMKAMCALGASLYAHGNYIVVPVAHHNLSIPGDTKNRAYTLVRAFTNLPAQASYKIRPNIEGPGNLFFPIFEGDSKNLTYDNRIGDYRCEDKFSKKQEFELIVSQENNNTIYCTRKVKGKTLPNSFMRPFDSFSRSEVLRDLQNSEGVVNTTNQLKERREQLQMLCDKIKASLKTQKSSGKRDKLIKQITEILEWSISTENDIPTIERSIEIEDRISTLEMLNYSQFMPLAL